MASGNIGASPRTPPAALSRSRTMAEFLAWNAWLYLFAVMRKRLTLAIARSIRSSFPSSMAVAS
jgi:hypothetical protein